MDVDKLDFEKGGGLLPAVVQHADSGQVLMLGYMNRSAVRKTLDEKKVTFYSRSRERLWTKGETSGNTLHVVDLQPDCDNDTLLILADPAGPACHTGEDSCFYRKKFMPSGGRTAFLEELDDLIRSRKRELPEDSYTASLFKSGIDRIAQKVGEEAVETVLEAKNSDNKALKGEAADLLYHLMVLLAERGITLEEVTETLADRHQQPNSKLTI